MASELLALKNISKRYAGVQALASVDFEIDRGEVHCLAGENGSGKSTLVKIISGVVEPDEGSRIVIDGEEQTTFHAIDAVRRGIEVIFQDLSLFPNLTVAENIAMSKIVAGERPLVQWPRVRALAEKVLKQVRIDLPMDEIVGNLPLADQQLVAICRALATDVTFLIMDEPTASLTRNEVDVLFGLVKDLKAKGITVLFISHKLDEVLQISDRVTVLKDGHKIGTFDVADVTVERLTELMTGRQLHAGRPADVHRPQEPLLEAHRLTKIGSYGDISFTLHRGEVLGVTGLRGSGRTELALTLFGLNPHDSGTLKLSGETVNLQSVKDALKLGIGYIPENRMVEGLVLEQSVFRNTIVTVVRRFLTKLGMIKFRRTQDLTEELVKTLDVRLPSVDSPVQTLSGGNQQKVVIAKWIATNPRILILNGPTVGIDVAAKDSIYRLIRRLADEGMGILFISDEVAEVTNNCDRVLVMHKGKLVAEFDSTNLTESNVRASINTAI